MPAATVTIRELKNKDTGIDLSIPTYKEIKGMLGSSYEYQVMVVSNLSYFKTAKHKDSDNVQFLISKKFADFEELYSKMNTKYSGTAFPPLPKRVLMVSEAVAKERRNGLEYIIKFLAMTPKLCICPLLLEFLGVSPKKMVKMEVSEKIVAEQEKQPEIEEQDMLGSETQEQEQAGDLFEEEDGGDEDSDMFSGISGTENNDTDETKIFAEQELGGGLEEGEDDDLFLLDAKIDNTQTADRNRQIDLEDNSDLFKIDDDLEKIMTLNLKPKTEVVEPDEKSVDSGDNFEGTGESLGDTGKSLSDTGINGDETVDQPVHVPGELDVDEKMKQSITEMKPEKPVVKSKPNISKKPQKANAAETRDEAELNFDSIVSEAEKVVHVNVPKRPKPAPRKKPSSKDKPDVPKRPETITPKPNVPKRPEVNQEKPSVPKRPEFVKAKPNVPKRPEVTQEKPNVPIRPEISDKPKKADKPKLPTESQSNKQQLSEEIQDENDVLKYIQENTATEEEIDLFS